MLDYGPSESHLVEIVTTMYATPGSQTGSWPANAHRNYPCPQGLGFWV